MKIGIIGCGYVGQACAIAWKQQGHTVSVTTRQPQRVEALAALADHVELLTSASLTSFIQKQDALLISVAPSSTDDYVSTYVKTAEQAVAALSTAPLLRQIIYTSSTSVYGDHQGAWIDETVAVRASSSQTQRLIEAENILLAQQTSQRAICVYRLGEIYGPERRIEERLQRMSHVKFPGTGQAYTNLIHLTDIVRACQFALTHHLSGIFNLCNDLHLPRHLFYDQLCEQYQLPAITWDPQQMSRHGGNKRVSNQRLKELGFTFNEPSYF